MEELAKHREAISALVDGELSADELAHTVARLGDSPADRLTWLAYHVTGDVMRAGPSLAGGADTAFMQRLKQALAEETPGVRPDKTIKVIATDAGAVRAEGLNDLNSVAANDAQFRWKWMAGLASVVMVSMVVWQSVDLSNSPAEAQLAQGAAVVTPVVSASLPAASTAPEPLVMLRDPQLDALLAAHRQFGGASAFQMPTGFLRNATFDGAEP